MNQIDLGCPDHDGSTITVVLITDDKYYIKTLVHALIDKAAGGKKQHGIMIPELLHGSSRATIKMDK
jgi:hypothetical protein